MTAMMCAECGATLPQSGECRALLHELLALEAQVAGAPGGVPHFLAVATYNLQHPSTFTSAALTWPTQWPTTVLDVCRLAPELYVDHVTRWAKDTIRTLDEAFGAPPGASE